MNKLATSLTLAAVIIFDVSGTDTPATHSISHPIAHRHICGHSTSLATLERLSPLPTLTQKSVDDIALAMRRSHTEQSIMRHTSEVGESTERLVHDIFTASRKSLETIHDLVTGDISGAMADVEALDAFDPELERACSSCIGTGRGLLSSIVGLCASIRSMIFGPRTSHTEGTTHTTETAENMTKEG